MGKIEALTTPGEVDKAIKNPEIPKLYSNAFATVLGAGDVAILLKNSAHPIAVLNLSFTAAKTLAIHLQQLVSHLESKSDHTIMTSEDILKYLTPEPEKP